MSNRIKPKIQIVPYKDKTTVINVKFVNGEPWLSAEQIAILFGTSTEEVERLIQEGFENYEFDPNAVTRVYPEKQSLNEIASIKAVKKTSNGEFFDQIMQGLGYKRA